MNKETEYGWYLCLDGEKIICGMGVIENDFHDSFKRYKPDGYRIMQNGGKFNDVGHYHLHIFPRYQGDGFGRTYGSENKKVNSEIAKCIRDKIK